MFICGCAYVSISVVYEYMCLEVYVCVYICLCVRMYVCVCLYICMYLCLSIYMYVCLCVSSSLSSNALSDLTE